MCINIISIHLWACANVYALRKLSDLLSFFTTKYTFARTYIVIAHIYICIMYTYLRSLFIIIIILKTLWTYRNVNKIISHSGKCVRSTISIHHHHVNTTWWNSILISVCFFVSCFFRVVWNVSTTAQSIFLLSIWIHFEYIFEWLLEIIEKNRFDLLLQICCIRWQNRLGCRVCCCVFIFIYFFPSQQIAYKCVFEKLYS